jgi:hypothetical protein
VDLIALRVGKIIESTRVASRTSIQDHAHDENEDHPVGLGRVPDRQVGIFVACATVHAGRCTVYNNCLTMLPSRRRHIITDNLAVKQWRISILFHSSSPALSVSSFSLAGSKCLGDFWKDRPKLYRPDHSFHAFAATL